MATDEVVTTYDVNCVVADIVLPGNGWMYVVPANVYYATLRSIELATRTEFAAANSAFRGNAKLRLDPSGDFIYEYI